MDSLSAELPGKPPHTYMCNMYREFERTPGDSGGRGAWHASIHEVAKSRTRLSNWTTTNICIKIYKLLKWCIFTYSFKNLYHSKCQVLGDLSQSLTEQVDKKIGNNVEKLGQLTLPYLFLKRWENCKIHVLFGYMWTSHQDRPCANS